MSGAKVLKIVLRDGTARYFLNVVRTELKNTSSGSTYLIRHGDKTTEIDFSDIESIEETDRIYSHEDGMVKIPTERKQGLVEKLRGIFHR